MFQGAEAKLRTSRIAFERLATMLFPLEVSSIQITSGSPEAHDLLGTSVGTHDPVALAEPFSSCLAQVRAVRDSVIKDDEARKVARFDARTRSKTSECKSDDLMKFTNDRRNLDLHAGHNYLVSTTHVFSLDDNTLGAPPSSGAALVLDGTGPSWLVDQGTPDERHLPCKMPDGSVTFSVAIATPPATHLGSALTETDPITILKVAMDYYARLLHEAKSKFCPQ